MRPDRRSSRVWTPEERRALAGLGPAWRLARKATGEVACPTCGTAVWARCRGGDGLHVDRLFAYAAHLRATSMDPPMTKDVGAVALHVQVNGKNAGDDVPRHHVADDAAFDLAVHHGLLRLATAPERWVLSEYGAACWCAS